jgi:hypothetical protein
VIPHDGDVDSRDAVERSRERKTKHLEPVHPPKESGRIENQGVGQPVQPEQAMDERERSRNIAQMHQLTRNLVDAGTSTTDLSEDRLMTSSYSRTSSPPKKPEDHKHMISPVRLPALEPNFAPPSALVHLVDDSLAVRPQIISWSHKGPENQGSSPEVSRPREREGEIESLDLDGLGDRSLGMPTEILTPSAVRRFRSVVVLANGDEDVVVVNEERKLLQPWIPARTETGPTEVFTPNSSPVI